MPYRKEQTAPGLREALADVLERRRELAARLDRLGAPGPADRESAWRRRIAALNAGRAVRINNWTLASALLHAGAPPELVVKIEQGEQYDFVVTKDGDYRPDRARKAG